MKKLGEFFQTEDWKKEKHVPVIGCPDNERALPPLMVGKRHGEQRLRSSQTKEENICCRRHPSG
jgi:hypothetical protein